MAQFEIIGEIDPFLRVRLRESENCFCQIGCMVMMDTTLDMRARLKGNVTKSLFRKMLGQGSFFFQNIEAERGAGECLISPALPGSLRILDIGEIQYSISIGSFLAASDNALIHAKAQSLDKAIFAKTGGMFILETEGFGQTVVSGFGSLYEVVMVPGHELIINNSHVVAWQSTLDFSISISTTEDGLLGNAVNAVVSGAGIVLRFSGYGKIIVCSRNRTAFAEWVKKTGHEKPTKM